MTFGKSPNQSELPQLRTFHRRQSPPGVDTLGDLPLPRLPGACHHDTPQCQRVPALSCTPRCRDWGGAPLLGQGQSLPLPTLEHCTTEILKLSSAPEHHTWLKQCTRSPPPARLDGGSCPPDCCNRAEAGQGSTGSWKGPGWSSRNTSCGNP